MRNSSTRYKLIDLFCGAGGMSLGFSDKFKNPFDHVWANDIDEICVRTYNNNFNKVCIQGDLIELLSSGIEIPQTDVVIGGPPCQGFSLLNKNRGNDPRNQLWRQYLEVVKKSEAKVFVMENVPYILGTFEHGEIVGVAESEGFEIWSGKLCAADYGVPQNRTRAFIIGSRIGNPTEYFPPIKTHYNPLNNGKSKNEESNYNENARPWKSVREAIIDLPEPIGTEIRKVKPPLDLHFGRSPTQKSIKRYQAIPNEGMNRFDLQRRAPELTPDCWIRKKTGGTDLFGRLWWDRPAFTIRTEFFKPEKGRYLHPEQHRPLTHREAARLSSFPDDFKFQGSKIQIAKQIGNAVPPLLAAKVAGVIRGILQK